MQKENTKTRMGEELGTPFHKTAIELLNGGELMFIRPIATAYGKDKKKAPPEVIQDLINAFRQARQRVANFKIFSKMINEAVDQLREQLAEED